MAEKIIMKKGQVVHHQALMILPLQKTAVKIKTLQEYFCVIPKSSAPSGGPLKWELHPCSSTEKCQNGACVPILSNVSSGTKTIERVSKRIPQGSTEVPKEAKGTPWMDRN